MNYPAILVLADGTLFKGVSIGSIGTSVGEVVFNTSMTGYQEILTDPSYSNQLVALTSPHIGNTGTNKEDEESDKIHPCGFIIKDLPILASNFRSQNSLSKYLQSHNIVAISNIDTRKLTRIIREKGSMGGCIMAGDSIDLNKALADAKSFAGLSGVDLAKVVTTSAPYRWSQGSWTLENGLPAAKQDPKYHIVTYDFGIKRNILRMLADRGCQITVVPAKTPASKVLSMKPDGVFLSNGPGDPKPCDYAIKAIGEILETEIPIFGICLGHQLLALASGASTIKMKFGHHGANHPVKDLDSGKVMITAQNHGFAVDEKTLPKNLRATHTSLFDGTLQGIHRVDKPAFGFQGHPEASPGPTDAAILFDHFIDLIEIYKNS